MELTNFINVKVRSTIKNQLMTARSICWDLVSGNYNLPHSDELRIIKLYLDSAWYLIDKYMNLDDPLTVRDFFQSNVRIMKYFEELKKNPIRKNATNLADSIGSQLDNVF